MLLEEFLENSAARLPGKLALIAGSRRLTYREIDEQANALAHSLIELGVRRGDRVAVCLDNSVEAVLSVFGVLKAGAVFVVLSSATKAEKLRHLLNQCSATCLVAPQKRCNEVCAAEDQLPHLRIIVGTGDVAEKTTQGPLKIASFTRCIVEGDRTCVPPKQNIDRDLAALIYTSASTGQSKGVMLTHLNMVSAAASITEYLQNTEDDVILNVLPLFFDYGLYQVLMGFKVGGTVVLEKSFAYVHEVLRKIQQEKVTGFPIVPTIAAMLLETELDTYDFSSLRYVTNTGAALPTDHIRRLCERFPQARLFSMYGLTECKRVSYLPPDQLEKRPTSVGKGMPNQEIYLVDGDGNRIGRGSIGELVVRGSHVMKGYWGMPEDTAHVLKPGAWGDEQVLHTGDWFHMDEEGYLYFVGRKDDMIKTGGRKVSPREVENVLQSMEEIAEAAVISQRDARLGQIVKAVVRLRHGRTIQPQDIIHHCTQYLEDFMVPKIVDIVPVLPKTESGKIDKKALAQSSASSLGREEYVEPMLRIEQVVAQNMKLYQQKTAVVYQGRHWSYLELRTAVDAKKLRLEEAGFSGMDRAIVWMENSPDYIATYLAVMELGGIVVALHQQTTMEEVNRIIRHVGAAGLIVSPTVRQWAIGDFESVGLRFLLAGDDVHRMNYRDSGFKAPEGSAQIIYTSGSTGRPKGVVLTHKNLIANTRSILEYLRLTVDDSVMAVLPFVYAYGNSVMLTHLFVGGTLVIENNMLYPHVMLDAMMKTGVTGFSGVSSTYAIILNQSNLKSYAFPALRYLTHAGGPMPSELLGRIRSVFPQLRIFLMYGQTEASARLTYLPPDLLDVKKGSAGRAVPGVTLKIVKEGGETARPGEIGEVWAYGDNIMQGYWQDPELTGGVLHEGWLHTGDLGRLDEEGFLTIEGRNNEMIKSGAYRISPTEIEEVLLQHPQIHEAGVVGIDDPILGQKICAVVTLKEPEAVTSQDLMAYCAQRLVQYKRPRVIVVIPALPKSPSGKILRQELRHIGMSHSPTPAVTSK
jgi:long-chain acyl-CoA synthetase